MSESVANLERVPTEGVLKDVENAFRRRFEEATRSPGVDALRRLRSDYFGPKGEMTTLLRTVGRLPPESRKEAGQSANALRRRLETILEEGLELREASARDEALRRERLDMTLPGRPMAVPGSLHPIPRIMQEIVDVLAGLGFTVAHGPEVELDAYNFEALNFPKEHPARDMQDTFFVESPVGQPSKDLLLRTHTSPVQIRTMLRQGAPLAVVSPGRVYRCDDDASHSPMFHQVEALCVDEGISMAHLLGTLERLIGSLFGQRPLRLRPSFFPFVEPGVEVDMQCVFCDGAGCRVCKETGWMEILGAGMVHPNVLRASKVDPERYTGFAFGIGVDRVAMLRHRIDDLSLLFRSDVRFLSQLK
jgi:phenylalanyl-tRNA synthetase alpha chain